MSFFIQRLLVIQFRNYALNNIVYYAINSLSFLIIRHSFINNLYFNWNRNIRKYILIKFFCVKFLFIFIYFKRFFFLMRYSIFLSIFILILFKFKYPFHISSTFLELSVIHLQYYLQLSSKYYILHFHTLTLLNIHQIYHCF